MIYTIKYLRYILSGFNIRKKWGAGRFAKGTLWMFLGGRPKMGSPSILKLPFWKDLMLLTQASLVEYTKLASIQLVIRLVWNLKKKKKKEVSKISENIMFFSDGDARGRWPIVGHIQSLSIIYVALESSIRIIQKLERSRTDTQIIGHHGTFSEWKK